MGKIMHGGQVYSGGGGSVVEANPSDTAGSNLTKIKIDGSTYAIPQGGGGGSVDDVQVDDVSVVDQNGIAHIDTMTGAGSSSAGAKGLVPAPASGDNEKFLAGDGTWKTVQGGGASAISDLTDVDLDNLSDGQILKWNATTEKWENANESGGSASWIDIVGTLTAGSTSITLSNPNIKPTSVLNLYADKYGVCPTNIAVTAGSITLTFEEQDSDLSVLVRITENNAEQNPYVFKNYLEVTDKGAYIDTGVSNTDTAYFEVDFQYTGAPANNDGVFGAMGSGNEFVVNSYGGVSYANCGAGRAVFTSQNLQRHVIKADASGVYIDNVLGVSVNWSKATGYNYFLFAFNYLNNQKYYTGNAKIYSVKIWNGNTLVRNMIPVIRNADGEIGMYDQVNDMFYANNGTGEFLTD